MRKNKIRILHVAQAAGGVDCYIRMLLKYLDKEKFENILVCSQDLHEEDYRGLADSFEPVSYTHLDVYKRQVSGFAGAFLCFFIAKHTKWESSHFPNMPNLMKKM